MGKLVCIGDIHGRAIWKKIIADNPDADKFIFLGDYFDSHEKQYHPTRQMYNFKDILNTQQELGEDRVILLLGNHDYHYFNNKERYSGYSQATYFNVHEDLQKAYKEGKIKIIHIEDDFLFSHAGVTEYWLKEVSFPHDLEGLNNPELFDFRTLEWNAICGWDDYGDTKSNSPIWVRPGSLIANKIEGYKQVIGHTTIPEKKMEDEEFSSIPEKYGVYFNDVLPHHYMIIENGKVRYEKVRFDGETEVEEDN